MSQIDDLRNEAKLCRGGWIATDIGDQLDAAANTIEALAKMCKWTVDHKYCPWCGLPGRHVPQCPYLLHVAPLLEAHDG